MGSVQDAVICPQCRFVEASAELFYRTGRELISCPRCGFWSDSGPYHQTRMKGHGSVTIKRQMVEQTLFPHRPGAVRRLLRRIGKRLMRDPAVSSVLYTTKVRGRWKRIVYFERVPSRPAVITRVRARHASFADDYPLVPGV
jgi:hypothetical protein